MPFTYEPYRSDLTGTIADLMTRGDRARADALRAGGNARARAAEIGGQNAANLAGSLGQIASGTLNTIMQQRADEPRRKMEQMKLEEQTREKATRENEMRVSAGLSQLFSGEKPPTPAAIMEIAGPERGMAIVKGLSAMRADSQKTYADTQGLLSDVLAGMDALPEKLRAEAYPSVRQNLLTRQIITDQDAPEQYDPAWFQRARNFGKEQAKPTLIQRDPEKPLVRQNADGTVTEVMPGVPAPPKPPEHSPAYKEWQDAASTGYKGSFTQYQTEDANRRRPVTNINTGGAGAVGADAPPDPASRDILSQTGLSLNAFRSLTGQTSQLPRDQRTRNRAAAEAQEFARKTGTDVSTIASQYKTYNDVLGANISRLNNTKIMESELEGTIDNLQGVASASDLGKLRIANVLKVWAGQEVNDDLAQQYALHLGQLRNELTAYYAATQGRSGNQITIQDQRDAELVIRNGVAKGSLDGLRAAVKNSTGKMGTVMQGSVNRARKEVWSLFGVGQNYKDPAAATKVNPFAPKK